MATVRRLTEQGVAEFRLWLENKAPGEPPYNLLDGSTTSTALSTAIDLERRSFETRYELGVYLRGALSKLNFAAIAFDAGLWDWITLFHFDAIAPVGTDGKRKLGEIARYSQDPGSRRWSRHVVRMSWLSVHNHGEHARYFLWSPLQTHSDILEQIAGQQEIFGSSSAVALGERLYWDVEDSKPKRGAGGKAAGSPRRFSKFMAQIRMTYDPDNMSVDQLIELLPREFDRWKPAANEKQRSGLARLLGFGTRAEGASA